MSSGATAFLRRLVATRQGACALAVAGAASAAGLVGLLDQWWPVVALAGFSACWLVPGDWWYPSPQLKVLPDTLSLAQATHQLRAAALPALTDAPAAALTQLLTRIEAVAPRLASLQDASSLGAVAQTELSRMVRMHLTGAVSSFLQVPPGAARTRPLAQGKSAEALFIEQLRWMQDHVQDLEQSLEKGDVEGLLLHHRLLRERYGLPAPDAPK